MEKKKKATKSSKTKENIIACASSLFSKHGYENTTIRDIASEANIDPALVIRYFGSKDRLFAKISHFDLRLDTISSDARKMIGPHMVKHFLHVWEDGDNSNGMQVLLRSAASNPEVAQKLQDIFQEQVFPFIANTTGRVGAEKRASFVATQLLGLAMCRYIFRIEPVVKLPQAEIISVIGGTIQNYLELSDSLLLSPE